MSKMKISLTEEKREVSHNITLQLNTCGVAKRTE